MLLCLEEKDFVRCSSSVHNSDEIHDCNSVVILLYIYRVLLVVLVTHAWSTHNIIVTRVVAFRYSTYQSMTCRQLSSECPHTQSQLV